MLKKFEKFQLITEYLRTKQIEISEFNKEHKVDASELINGRNLTNLGTFRAYLKAYLENHPKIHNNMTFLIRHLPPGEHGLPIEIYVFSNDQVWPITRLSRLTFLTISWRLSRFLSFGYSSGLPEVIFINLLEQANLLTSNYLQDNCIAYLQRIIF